MFTEFDIDTWPRKSTYEFFKDYEDPFFNFTGNIDVTNLYRFCKKNEFSFSSSALFCTQTAANGIREFRIRQLGNRLVEFDKIHATQTILNDNETYSFCYFEWQNDIVEFNRAAKRSVEKYKELQTFDVESDRIDLIYYSVIPWVSFTSFKHASRLDNTQTIPRIVFGKIFDDDTSKRIPLSVEANHRIMDGLHVGKLFIEAQKIADSL